LSPAHDVRRSRRRHPAAQLVGGVQIDEAVTRAFLAALEPAKLAATVAAAERLEADRETSLRQWRLGVERASYEASRAERRYRAVDPDNRLVARGPVPLGRRRLVARLHSRAFGTVRVPARARLPRLLRRARAAFLGPPEDASRRSASIWK
jgi:hypothetical protein